jgi:hypothetical protein
VFCVVWRQIEEHFKLSRLWVLMFSHKFLLLFCDAIMGLLFSWMKEHGSYGIIHQNICKFMLLRSYGVLQNNLWKKQDVLRYSMSSCSFAAFTWVSLHESQHYVEEFQLQPSPTNLTLWMNSGSGINQALDELHLNAINSTSRPFILRATSKCLRH